MIIRVRDIPESSQGAYKFARQLRSHLENRHTLIEWNDPERADVSLVRGSVSGSDLGRIKGQDSKLVVQYGGWDFSPASSLVLRQTISAADAVVYNSRYGQDCVHKKLTGLDFPRETVIPNGAFPTLRANLNDPICLLACDNYDIPIKSRAYQAALEAMPFIEESYPDAELLVLGRKPVCRGRYAYPVGYAGYIQDESTLERIRASASVLLHLVEGDNCPNTVVEALGQGIPVVCHRNSGVPEIAKFFGKSSLHDDPKDVASKAVSLLRLGKTWQDKWMNTFNRTLRIDVVTERYEKFMESL